MEEHQWNLADSSNGPILDEYIENLKTLRSDLASRLEDSVDKLLIRPLTEYQLSLEKVESIIKKRNNKLLDYDRNRISYEKMVANPSKRNEMSEEKKILKVQIFINYSFLIDLFLQFIARAIIKSGYFRI